MSEHREWSEEEESEMKVRPGQTAYEAYATVRNWRTFDGTPMAQWGKLAPVLRHAWLVAALTVVREHGGAPSDG